ncbi:uncharacterized protein FRV6_15861 [Fusarium oxysporum]|uniref:Uncharacterized protein n=1 Tax=Fusarium oxysporum TaxID=5507 RepID=A0A2H3TSX8_FUSOX|nr:uncharacterized protein FRV6_15861 [Fusarium oxysporum]
MPYRRVGLSNEELERLQEAFLDFEIQRHHLVYDKLLLHQTEIQKGMLLPIYDERSFLAGYLEDDSIEGSRQSIFCFTFQCYGKLIHQVERQLELEKSRQTTEPHYSELVLVERFRSRTRDEELRYIALLCLQGYVCLRIAEKYIYGDLRVFILNSFMWFCKDGKNHIPDPDGRLGVTLNGSRRSITPMMIQLMSHGAEGDSSGTNSDTQSLLLLDASVEVLRVPMSSQAHDLRVNVVDAMTRALIRLFYVDIWHNNALS